MADAPLDKSVVYEYTPLSRLVEGSFVNVHARVVGYKPPRRTRNDWHMLLFVTDFSVGSAAGGGQAALLPPKDCAVMFFCAKEEHLPASIIRLLASASDGVDTVVVQLRRFRVQRYQEQWQLLSRSYSRWSVYWHDRRDDQWHSEPPHSLSASELAVLRPFCELAPAGAAAPPPSAASAASGRPLLRVSDLQPDASFDVVGQVVRVVEPLRPGECLQVVLTDYTSNTMLPALSAPATGDAAVIIPPHSLLHVSVWDNWIAIAQGVCRAGSLVRLSNLRSRLKPRPDHQGSELCAVLHGSRAADKQEFFILPVAEEDPAARDLLHRQHLLRQGAANGGRAAVPPQLSASKTRLLVDRACGQEVSVRDLIGQPAPSAVDLFVVKAIVKDVSEHLQLISKSHYGFCLQLQDATGTMAAVVADEDVDRFIGAEADVQVGLREQPRLRQLSSSLLPSDFLVARYRSEHVGVVHRIVETEVLP